MRYSSSNTKSVGCVLLLERRDVAVGVIQLSCCYCHPLLLIRKRDSTARVTLEIRTILNYCVSRPLKRSSLFTRENIFGIPTLTRSCNIHHLAKLTRDSLQSLRFLDARAITLFHVCDGALPPSLRAVLPHLSDTKVSETRAPWKALDASHRKERSTLTRVSIYAWCCLLQQDNKSEPRSPPGCLTSPLLGFACQQRGHFHFIGR